MGKLKEKIIEKSSGLIVKSKTKNKLNKNFYLNQLHLNKYLKG